MRNVDEATAQIRRVRNKLVTLEVGKIPALRRGGKKFAGHPPATPARFGSHPARNQVVAAVRPGVC